jgi:hypothetical protein
MIEGVREELLLHRTYVGNMLWHRQVWSA